MHRAEEKKKPLLRTPRLALLACFPALTSWEGRFHGRVGSLFYLR